MSIFEEIKKEVDRGLNDENAGIPIGFEKLNSYIGIRKKIYTLVFGSSGTGKSSLVHNAYILNPYDWYIANKATTKIKLKIVYFSMERSSTYIVAKWIARKMFLDHETFIPVPRLLGWKRGTQKLSSEEYELFLSYKDYIEEMTDVIEIVDGAQNPTAIYKWIKDYAERNGEIEQISEYKKIYIPNNEHLITLIIVDHQSLIRREKGVNTKKEAIDKLSQYLQQARDFYSFSPILVAQMNRDIANPIYQKMESFEPIPEQIKDSGTTYEDSDVCISLFDPAKFKTSCPTGHDLSKLIGPTGAKFYRSLKIHKSTWSEDDIRVPLGFHGALGLFKELKKRDEMNNTDYDSILDGSYFLT